MESIIICGVCYENYDHKYRAPRVLSCGHTLCTKCLKIILESSTLQKKCSFDNIPFTSSQNSVESFPFNFSIKSIIEQKKDPTCKAHPRENLKLICLTDGVKICFKCVKHHKNHEIKKLKALQAEGAKVKQELQEILTKAKDTEMEKVGEFEQVKNTFLSTIGAQFTQIEHLLAEKRFELLQQATSLFDAHQMNASQANFAFQYPIGITIEDITYADQDEDGDMMRLNKTVNSHDQNSSKRSARFLRKKSSRVQKKVLGVQRYLKDATDNFRNAINSLQLPAQDLVEEIYSAQEESEQLSQEELARRHKKLKALKFTSHFDIIKTERFLEILTHHRQPNEIQIDPDDLQEIAKVSIHLARYETLRNGPSPNILSYIVHRLENLVDFEVTFEPLNFTNDALCWLGETIQGLTQNLERIDLRLQKCPFNDDTMPILCQKIFSQAINLDGFVLELGSCQIIDADLKFLAEFLKPIDKNLRCFALGLAHNDITSLGIDEIFKLIESMDALEQLALNLEGLDISNESFKMLGENVLPRLKSLDNLFLILNGSPISDECIGLILKNLPNLKKLDIDFSGTLLTDETVQMFTEKVLPRLEGSMEVFSFAANGTQIKPKKLEKMRRFAESLKQKSDISYIEWG